MLYLFFMAALSKNDIRLLLQQRPPLIEGYLDLEVQLQPNGIDTTLRDISHLDTAGSMAVDNAGRRLSLLTGMEFDRSDWITLQPGPYLITLNEIVNLPVNVMALGRPRSSLLRCGVTIGTAVWDAGYSGRSQALLTVHNPAGFRLQKNARVLQLVFFSLTGATDGYQGKYQGENI
jgi:dUTP pyrophosphatase